MEISREKLSAKLDTIPEADREGYVSALRDKGYTWGVGETKDAPAQPQEQPKGGAWNSLTTKDLSGKNDPLALAARLGQFANEGNQQLASVVAEKSGQYEAARSAQKGDAYEVPVPKFLAGGQEGQTIQLGAIPGVAAAGALGTASEFLLPQNRLGVAAYALAPIAKAYKYLKGAPVAGAKPGIVARIGESRTKVPAADIQQYIDNPAIADAPSPRVAGEAYGQATGSLKGKIQSLGDKLDMTIIPPAEETNAINNAGRALNSSYDHNAIDEAIAAVKSKISLTENGGGELSQDAIGDILGTMEKKLSPKALAAYNDIMSSAGDMREMTDNASSWVRNLESVKSEIPDNLDPQTALESVQSINEFLKNKVNTMALTPDRVQRIQDLKSGLMAWMEGNGLPDIRQAARGYREAMVNENMSKLLPRNKYGSTDALRTMFAGSRASTAAGLAIAGYPLAAVPIAMEAASTSPAVWGAGIRNMNALVNPSNVSNIGSAITASQNIKPTYRVGPSKVEQSYMNNR